MTVWERVNPNECYAVAIHNFPPKESNPINHLTLDVGELVCVERECQRWYYGHIVHRPDAKGIFPKSYVVIRHCTVEQSGNELIASAAVSPVVHEITQTLRDWEQQWKHLFIASDERFKFIEVSMRALLELRSQMLSSTLPQDQLKKVQRTAIFTIDKGNRALGMDLTVRCPSGRVVDPFEVSTWKLNSFHVETNNRIDKNMEPSPSSTGSSSVGTPRCYTLSVSVRNFVCKMSDDAELLMSLFDGVRCEQLTEHYVVRWSRAGLASDVERIHNLHVLFTDLGLRDIRREKVFLVCFVVRIGGMDPQNMDNRRSSVSNSVSAAGRMLSMIEAPRERSMRRPFGVACADITRALSSQQQDDKQHCVQFFPCEKENLDTLLKKIIANRDLKQDTKNTQGLWISLKLLHGDLKQIREDSPHLMLGNPAIARKMGFPEVILPGDARNDLYVTLVSGSFTKGGGKSTDRNIEVTVRVADKNGVTIPSVISLGGGSPLMSEYTSVVYYHEDRPRWQEVFKICATIEEFKEAHLVFLFRHRSSNEAKDKTEKHFALSYVRLMQGNGTTLSDIQHNLCVYKLDIKKWPNTDTEAARVYLELPSRREEIPSPLEKESKIQKSFLSLVHKDVFSIETNVCSTKLTQKEEILGVLNWVDRRDEGTLRQSLALLLNVPNEELVKFLQDILDALFSVLTQVEEESGFNTYSEGSYDVLVLDCLMKVIGLVSDHKYQHFQPVLDVYIDESFCNTLAYEKLLRLLSYHILNAEADEGALKKLLQCMKCLEYLIRFIIRSRELRSKLGGCDDLFRSQFHDLLQSIVWLMHCNDSALTCQGSCLKYLPHAVPHIIRVYPDVELSKMLVEVFNSLPLGRLTTQRMLSILELVRGPLFLSANCRRILVPHVAQTLRMLILNHTETNRCGVEMRSKNRSVDKVARVLGASRRKLEEHKGQDELLEICVQTLGELLSLLHRSDVGSTMEDSQVVACELLRTIVRAAVQMDRERARFADDDRGDDPLLRQIVSVLLDMLRHMDREQYSHYIDQLVGSMEILDFLTEIQLLLRELVEKPVYKSHWADMINLQNYIVLNSLRLFATTLEDLFLEPFEKRAWQDWFGLCIAFATQSPLQVERMSVGQRKRLLSKYGDMRRDASYLIRNMWFALLHNKRIFIPSLVGPFLEVSLIPEAEVRKATIPLFFDMMQTEFNSRLMNGDVQDDKDICKSHFKEFENEMIDKLDVLVESGKGDSEWRALFVSLVGALFQEHDTLRELGCCFVAIIGRLMDTLLCYRDAQDVSVSHKMQVTTHVLEFYKEIERPHMYIRYVHKLCEMHRECGHWGEAGLALRLHATLLSWSDAPVAARLRHPHAHALAHTHRELKEALYLDIIEHLHEGKMWELAVEVCKELVTQYEEEVFDYQHLSDLYQKMAKLYHSILVKIRGQPGYFRVIYYGLGFPEFLRNKQGYVYRGKEYELLQEFTARLLTEWPNAEVLTKLDTPGDDIINSRGQYLQINAVEPIMCEKKKRLSGKPVASQILSYYKNNNVDKFIFSRPFYRQEESMSSSETDLLSQNEFACLWLERTELEICDKLPGILRWFPVISRRTYEMSPLEVAIETMQEANRNLKVLVLEHKASATLPLDPLTRKLNGIVDAAVMGGIVNYERAFFTEEYATRHPEDSSKICILKDLIAEQIPLLEFGIEVHRVRAPTSLTPLHQHIVECFERMRTHVYDHYGRKKCDLSAELQTVNLRRQVVLPDDDEEPGSRLSELSAHTVGSTDSAMKSSRNFFSPLSRNSVGVSVGQFGTLQNSPAKRREKEKRKARKSELGSTSGSSSVGASQWYMSSVAPPRAYSANPVPLSLLSLPTSPTPTDMPSPLRELRQELTASRPLRSEAEREKRFSQRPTSMQSGVNSNRNSIGTTDSNQEEEDPPPLPQKTSKSEHTLTNLDTNENEINQAFNNIHETLTRTTSLNNNDSTPILTRYNYDTVVSPRGSFLYSSLQTNRIILGVNKEKAPTPPPKRKNKPPNNL